MGRLSVNHNRMNMLLTVEHRTTPPHDLAEVDEVWKEHGKVWGHVASQTGREYRQSDQMESANKHVIYTQFYPSADSRMRLKYGARTFHVEAVYPLNGQSMRTQWNVVEVLP